MVFSETSLPGLVIIDLEPHFDDRGYFARTFCRREFAAYGLEGEFVQSNISHNRQRGTMRGMHYQLPPHNETKLVRCSAGAVYDVVVDLRAKSPTFGFHFGVELTEESNRMLYIPVGFAHGFLTLRDDTVVLYQMGDYYKPEMSMGFRWDDAAFQIDWPATPQVLSERDASFDDIDLSELDKLFAYENC